jgi:autotransporter-associated beta strand protein
LDGTSITKYNVGTIFSASNCSSNNSTKSTPCLSADILGDWREEVIFRTSDNTKLRVYTTTTPTTNKLYTLMHDAQYRNSIAWQNTAYNQPPYCGFYVGDDMDTEPVSAIYDGEKRWNNSTVWDENTSNSWTDSLGNVSAFKSGDKVIFDITAGANAAININGNLSPKRMKVNSPYNVVLSGTGTLNGEMDLKKIGAGSLTLNNTNNFTGTTMIWDGDFYNNGTLTNSAVSIFSFVKLGGKGIFGNDVNLGNNTTIDPGEDVGLTSKLTFLKNLTDKGAVVYNFDVKVASAVVSNDTLMIGGNWTLSSKSTLNFNITGGTLPIGDFLLAHCSGTISGNLSQLSIAGIPTNLSYTLFNQNGNLILHVQTPATLVWKNSIDSKWDNNTTSNWLVTNAPRTFLSNDSVLFNDSASAKSVIINESVQPATITVEASSNYSFSGTGSIVGSASLLKNGTGNLIITTQNSYMGKTLINNGSVEISSLSNGGVNSPIGAASNTPDNLQLNGGKLSYTGNSVSIDRGFTLGSNNGTISVGNSAALLTIGGKITGTGKLIKDGAGRLALSGTNNYSGGTLIKGGSILLTTDAANTSGLGSDTITLQGGSLMMYDSNTTDNTSTWKLNIPGSSTGNLNVDGKSTIQGSIFGGGTLNYFNNYTGNVLASDVSQFTGTINVTTDTNGGNFVLYSTKGYANAKINLNNLVTTIYRVTSNITIPIGDLTGLTNSVLGAGGSGPCTITWEIGARNANSTFNGLISNVQYSGSGAVAAIKKVGSGTWTITHANTFSGGTIINNGVLMVNNTSGSGLGTGTVTVNQGGTLAGNGIITGDVTINSGGILSPANGVGTLTLGNVNIGNGGILLIDIDKTTVSNDLVSLTGSLTLNGVLQINPMNGTTFAAGDAFKIINGNVTGTPVQIIPATPGDGLEWDFSDFATLGTLKVKTTTGFNNPEVNTLVYPNPFKNELSIKFSQPVDDLKVSIFNMIGEEVFSHSYNHYQEVSLNIGSLPKGIYMLQLEMDHQSVTKKLVKE